MKKRMDKKYQYTMNMSRKTHAYSTEMEKMINKEL